MGRFWVLAFVAVGGCLLLSPSPARAVINADNPNSATPDNTTPPAGLPQWNNVGVLNDASGIYVGNGWVLTAYHVGAGSITLCGTTYDWNGQPEIRLNNTDGSGPADLVMFQLTSQPAGLSPLAIAFNSAPVGTPFYNVGNGVARDTAEEYFTYDPVAQTFTQTSDTSAPYQGFGFGSTNIMSWGQNVVQGTTSYNLGFGEVNALLSTFSNTAGPTDQIIFGDSGGGAFDDTGQLIGVNDAINVYEDSAGNPDQPGNTVLFGDQSEMVDIAPFYSQIQEISGVPEPSSLALLALGGVALLCRRRRAAHAFENPNPCLITLPYSSPV